ncbi:MAG TPA: hypothetical protein VFG24_02145 [Nitrosopumilaceae archaeon]|nr:hypothetical protein [Nitrosopumilaceae archaeon]
MEKFRIGDRVRITHTDKKEDELCTILDILEDYGGNSYWLKFEDGHLLLEIETPETAFEKVIE